ncbi:hypothetical protein H5410_054281 [Solanum commersonii]|uniref:Uncharacterized protein n=1 Tax=Solanum commersonii TaxID=4109 RepID=A0A9J5X8R8_SOLCO|nr:hypothetical protein H5410_054281 [Solanum commersonii]
MLLGVSRNVVGSFKNELLWRIRRVTVDIFEVSEQHGISLYPSIFTIGTIGIPEFSPGLINVRHHRRKDAKQKAVGINPSKIKAEELTKSKSEIGSLETDEALLDSPKTIKFHDTTMTKGIVPPTIIAFLASCTVFPAILQMKGVITWNPIVSTATGIAGKTDENLQEANPKESRILILPTNIPITTNAVMETSIVMHRHLLATSITLKGNKKRTIPTSDGNSPLART